MRRASLAVLAALLLSACSRPAEVRPKANILLVVVDTLRADHLGCYGYARKTSPRIDAFAAESTLFEQAHSPSPWTMPSMASILTSLTPRDHGLYEWRQQLEPELLTLPEHLRAHGYRTAAVVGNAGLSGAMRFDQGFDVYDIDFLRGLGDLHEASTSAEITDHALSAMEGREPFFVWAHYFDPHDLYVAHPGFEFGGEDMDRYDSEIAFTDHHVGRLLDGVRARGLEGRTIVVFVADHGEEFRDHGQLRHSKTLYEEVLHVPLIVRVPGFRPARVPHTVRTLDIAPTVAALVGLPVPAGFTGHAWRAEDGAFRTPLPRTLVAETRRLADKRGIREGSWKLILDRPSGRVELFDLASDPEERKNRVRRHPEIAAALQAKLEEYYKAPGRAVATHALTPEMEETLKSLGYLQ